MPLDYCLVYPWPGPLIWTILYISDYYCTLAAARMIKQGVDKHIGLEKGYELTPYYQPDIARLKKVSGRFILILALFNLFLCATWYLGGIAQIPQAYEFFLGALILIELTVHVRHLHNLGSFLYYRGSHGVSGKLTFAHWLELRLSALDILAFGILWLILFAITFRWLFAGGAFKCFATAHKHWQLSNRDRCSKRNAEDSDETEIHGESKELTRTETVV